jgi:NAD(P)-dependent dehydrogenase (short-subunit alcohol dehydrogenase family)
MSDSVFAGKVAIVTGAGRGLGREYALALAALGAQVVVNDLGSDVTGAGADSSLAAQVVDEITEAGGQAVANSEDVATWSAGQSLIDTAIDAFGRLDVVVNNAGLLRDRMLVNMTEEEFDSVIRSHLKGHFVVSHFAAAHWRSEQAQGRPVKAAIVNTTSTSGLLGNVGQANYGAAKAAIASLTIIAAMELSRYGVRVNAVAPAARTRMTEATPGFSELVKAPDDPSQFDQWHPANVAPVVTYLASDLCNFTGRVFFAQGGHVQAMEPWSLGEAIDADRPWTLDELAERLPGLSAH